MKKLRTNKKEGGITLVALIITIIVLVILAAVSISAVYKSKIIEYAVNGSIDYTTQAVKENQILKGSVDIIESGIGKIKDIIGDNGGVLDIPTNPVIPVTGIALSQTSAEMIIGVTELILVPTVQPPNATNQNVTWTSSNEEVATVDENGIVTAKTAGAVNITVTADEDKTKTATCNIVVSLDKYRVGAYVSYVPKASYQYEIPRSRIADSDTDKYGNPIPAFQYFHSHTSTNENISNTDWRVWDKLDSTHVRLISTTASTDTILFHGANGYNNAVGVLNQACSTVYSHTDYASAKSIDMEDIEKISNYVYSRLCRYKHKIFITKYI